MSPTSDGCVFSVLRGCLRADDSKDFLAGITLPFTPQTHDSLKRKALGSGRRGLSWGPHSFPQMPLVATDIMSVCLLASSSPSSFVFCFFFFKP